MKELAVFIVAGVLTEGVTETIKQLRKDGKLNRTMLVSIIVGEVFAFSTGIDIVKDLGFEVAIPFVGVFITGLLISRGSNYIADLVTKLTNGDVTQVTINNSTQDDVSDDELETLLDELEKSLD